MSKTDIVQADTPRNVGLFLIFFRINISQTKPKQKANKRGL